MSRRSSKLVTSIRCGGLGLDRDRVRVRLRLRACVPACTLLTPLDGLSDGEPAPRDAGADDVVHADAGEAASMVDGGTIPATASLLREWTFESSCEGWALDTSTLTFVPDEGRSGGACRVCATSQAEFDVEWRSSSPAAGTYFLETWVRHDGDSPAPGEWMVFLDVRHGELQTEFVNSGPVSDAYARAFVQAVVEPRATALNVEIGGHGPTGSCVLVDDVRLYYAPP